MGLSGAKNICCFEFLQPSSRGWIQRTGKGEEGRDDANAATVTLLSTGENNSTGASRHRVISPSSFVVGARLHRPP